MARLTIYRFGAAIIPLAAGLATAGLVSGAPAIAAETHKAMAMEAMTWGPAPSSLPKGAEATVLSGDPGKPGPFTIRLKMPAGYAIPAHQHPTFEAVTVISGKFNIGMGDKLTEAGAEALGPGGFVNLPAKMNHFAFSSEASVVQINSTGPFEIKYVNPADDPRNTK